MELEKLGLTKKQSTTLQSSADVWNEQELVFRFFSENCQSDMATQIGMTKREFDALIRDAATNLPQPVLDWLVYVNRRPPVEFDAYV